MPLGKRRRRSILTLGLALVSLVCVWLSLPLWFPWLLRPGARRAGVYYARYERLGYGRFQLSDVGFTNASIKFHADRIEALTPQAWLWRCAIDKRLPPLPFVLVSGWRLESVPQGKGIGSPTPSVYAITQSAASTFATLKKWLPTAVLSNGVVQLNQAVIPVAVLAWNRGILTAEIQLPQPLGASSVRGELAQPPTYQVRLNSAPMALATTVNISNSLAGLQVQSSTEWRSNHVELSAQFGTDGTLPAKARLDALSLHLPAELLRLAQYDELRGSASAEWEHGRFGLQLKAAASPLSLESNLPPLQVEMRAGGDTNGAVVHSATLAAPGLTFDLSKEFRVYFQGPLLQEPVHLRIDADPAHLPWLAVQRRINLQGHISGEAEFFPSTERFPAAQFRIGGSELASGMFTAKSFTSEGRLDWPWLAITQAKATLTNGASATVTGRLDLERSLISDGHLLFNGPLAGPWLPAGYSTAGISLAADFHGPLPAPVHDGHLDVTNFIMPQFRPVHIHADWQAEKENLREAAVLISAGESSLLARGALSNTAPQTEIKLEALTLSTNRQPLLVLSQPCRIVVGHSKLPGGFLVSATAIDWTGAAGEFHAQGTVDWPRQGDLHVSMQKLSSTLVSPFAETEMPELQVQAFEAAAAWTNGPAMVAVDLSATANVQSNKPLAQAQSRSMLPEIPIQADLQLRSEPNGLAISNLVITSRTSTVAVAHGLLPLNLVPGSSNLLQLDLEKPLRLNAAARPQAFFWEQLGGLLDLRLEQPNLDINVSGTWAAPRGEVDLQVHQLAFQHARKNMPALAELRVKVELDRQQARLTEGQLLIQGQPLRLTAELPLGESFWAGLREKKFPNLEHARAHLEIERAELAAFAPLLPQVLAPQGDLHLDFSLVPGGELEGELVVRNGRTRPLGNAGPIRDIELTMRFHERQLELEHATANAGGAALSLSGQADLHGTQWLGGALPPFHFELSGTNIALARQPDFVLRSDLLLGLTKTNGAPPLISGTATLRDSFYLSDVRELVPGGVASPSRRPPYFSVEDPAFADWRLAVDVKGAQFLKVRSTLFNGTVSANLKLQGTLQEPIALGDARVGSGTVSFPFANLQVQQGFVTLSSQDPYHPQVSVTAFSKQFSYDIRMAMSGPVDAPVIQFTSTPPLSSEQILLMVTAGELPQGAYTLTAQQKAQTMALFLGRDLLSKVGLGDVSQQRLTISSGQEITDQGRPTYYVEYKLTDRWALGAEYDRFGDLNAGLKWRIYSK